MPVRKTGGIPAHHQDAYNEFAATGTTSKNVNLDTIGNGATILAQAITTTKTCVIVAVGTVVIEEAGYDITDIELEQPKGTIVVDNEDATDFFELIMFHYASWRFLEAGTYTFELVNRGGGTMNVAAAQLKLVAVGV